MRKQIIAILTIIALCISLLSVQGYAASQSGGTVTVKYGDSAAAAGVVLKYIKDTPVFGNIPIDYREDFEMGQLSQGGDECVYILPGTYSDGYTLDYWLLNGPGYKDYKLTPNAAPVSIQSDSGNGSIRYDTEQMDYYTSIESFMAGGEYEVESVVLIKQYMYISGDWTIEPIFSKASPYTFFLDYSGADPVDKSAEVSLDICVEGGAYDCLSASITYESDLFVFESCTNDKITVDDSTDGILKLTATGLEKEADAKAGALVFKAKAVSASDDGSFDVTGAKVGTSQEAISEDALEAKKAAEADVVIGVNSSSEVVIKFWIDWTDPATKTKEIGSLAPGADYNIDMDEIIEIPYDPYDPEGYLYTFETQGLRSEVKNGRFYIYGIDRDLDIVISRTKTLPGELTSYYVQDGNDIGLRVFNKTYEVVKFDGTPAEGKTFFYEDVQMIKSGDYYICIIGLLGEDVPTKAKIVEKEGTDIIMVSTTGEVNQTDIVDINDAQLVSDLYNGKYNDDDNYTDDFDVVAMVKYLAADINKDGAVTITDVSAVIESDGFEY